MNMHKIVAFFYIATGFALIILFGGKLIMQLLGVTGGLYMIWRGLAMLNSPMIFNATFRNFTRDKFR